MLKAVIAVLALSTGVIACSDRSEQPVEEPSAEIAIAEQQAAEERKKRQLEKEAAAEAAAKIKADAIAQAKLEAEAREEARRLALKRAELDKLKYKAVAAIHDAEIIANAQKKSRIEADTIAKSARKDTEATQFIRGLETAPQEPQEEPSLEPKLTETTEPAPAETIKTDISIASGSFNNSKNLITGNWSIKSNDGQLFLLLDEAFAIPEGKETSIALSGQSLEEVPDTAIPANLLHISPLNHGSGKQEYVLPAQIDFDQYKSLHIINSANDVSLAGSEIHKSPEADSPSDRQ